MNPISPKLRDMVLSNDQRLKALGLQSDALYRQYHALSQSKLHGGKIAEQYAHKLSSKLDGIEWDRSMQPSHDNVPALSGTGFPVLIGHTVESAKDYCLNEIDLTKHVIVSGSSGAGKTTLIKSIIEQVATRYPVIFFDHKDEGGRFVHSVRNSVYVPLTQQRWNCLSGQGDQVNYALFFVTALSRFAGFLPVTTNAVRAWVQSLCSDKNDLPSISDLSKVFEKLAYKEKRNNLHTASRAIDDLSTIMGDWSRVRSGVSSTASHSLTVFPYKDIPASIENFLISLLYKQYMDDASHRGHTSTLSRLFVFDEGRGFFGKEFEATSGSGRLNIQTEIATKSRSYGLGNFVATQSAQMLQSTILDNAGTFIALRSNSESESKFCCRRLGLDEAQYRELMELKIGEAYIVSPRCSTPCKIRIPYADLGVYPSEAEIAAKMKPLWDSWNAQSTFAPIEASEAKPRSFRDILSPSPVETAQKSKATEKASKNDTTNNQNPVEKTDTKSGSKPFLNTPLLSKYVPLLKSCLEHPEYGATAHYKHLGWSAGKGTRIKKKLIGAQWLYTERIRSAKGGRPKEVLKLTDKGKEVLNEG